MKGFEKNFGFGFMRLPEIEKGVYDIEETEKMVDLFMNAGFTYFDTAHGYCDGKSEEILRLTLTSRYPRESYTVTDKLSGGHFKSESDIRPLFESQLKAVGVDYFDFYLMHAQDRGNYGKYKECRAYETAFELKKEGKIRHVGISFHDNPDLLDEILTEHPGIEVVQLQFNYIDYESPSVRARECYEICYRHNKPVIVMEPVKGGKLANPPEKAAEIFDALGGGSYAQYAIRYAAGFENVVMVLSGMSNCEMVRDNVSFMQNFRPLDEREKEAVDKVVDIFNHLDDIPCTACSYCTENCPMDIPIPDIFSCMNTAKHFNDWNQVYYYNVKTTGKGKASDCIKCGMCEDSCPQHIEIRNLLETAAEKFENQEVESD
ncbi:MAG: aldo/keto reductase [Clostridia bacterium]|nr:aldo/keto reductase [Clostridia bacterium]